MRDWIRDRGPALVGLALCWASVAGWVALLAWAVLHAREAGRDRLIIERHDSMDRRPSRQHEQALYQALIEHYAGPVEVDEAPEDLGPEPPLVPMDQVEGAIPSSVDGEGR